MLEKRGWRDAIIFHYLGIILTVRQFVFRQGRGRQVVRQRSAKPLSRVRFPPAPPAFPAAITTILRMLLIGEFAGILAHPTRSSLEDNLQGKLNLP
jgi:hypothetical protein